MNKYYWVMFSGKVMLCFTMRTTKNQCINDHLRNYGRDHLRDEEKCRKVTVSEFNPSNNEAIK